jgi:probable DNA repair protein
MAPAERNARAEFDAFELRHLHVLRPELSLAAFTSMVATSRRQESLTHLLTALRALERTMTKESSPHRSWTEWTEHFGKLLDAASWGPESHEDSIEFQIRRRWESALDELASLNLHGGSIDYSRALASLEWIANKTMFAPESREAPIQIMGPLEAAGARFDALWFLRAGELTWPVLPQRNVLLPWHLQREFGMPGVEITRDDEHARRLTDRIAATAGIIIFSYAEQTASGHQLSSSLLERHQLGKLEPHTLQTPIDRSNISLDLAEDTEPLPPLPDAVTRGGAEILRLQAACGFRAFAERRLWSAELKRLESGMDSAERGNVVHRALQFFWTEIKTHAALNSLLAQERDAAIARAVNAALEPTTLKAATAWERSYVEMQHLRLVSLMRSWLDLEAARSPFSVSISEHEFDDVRVGPLRMKVRVDRVDTGDEGEIFIDYKSGSYRPSAWLTDRPDQPQLPLYTILSGAKKVEGVAFGIIRAGEEMTLTGYATTKGTITKSVALKEADTLEEQIDRWHNILTRLAEDFHSGKAAVDPKHYPSTCEHCAQRIFCRFDVASAIEEDAGDGEHG